jgi:hypothetical protein
MNIILKMITDNQISNRIIVDIETDKEILENLVILTNHDDKLIARGVVFGGIFNINFDDVEMIVNHHTKKLIFIAVR